VESLMISLLQVSCWVWWWKNFENRSIFCETVDKSVSFFMTHGMSLL